MNTRIDGNISRTVIDNKLRIYFTSSTLILFVIQRLLNTSLRVLFAIDTIFEARVDRYILVTCNSTEISKAFFRGTQRRFSPKCFKTLF